MQVPRVKSLPVPFEPATTRSEADLSEWLVRCAIVACLAAFFYAGLSGRVFQPLFSDVKTVHWSKVFVRPSMVWGTMGLLLLSFRTALWFYYRPFPSVGAADAPHLTVIIPAYNEGQMVEKSIDSVAAANYPSDRLEIIVVDDGSKDNTWQYIRQTADRFPGLVTPVRFLENRGKRAALEAGFRQAKGEIVVTIDSDSVIEPDTLLAIAGPFRDPSIAAVAGKVAVYNRQRGAIPRMLHVRYMNFILSQGYDAVYQRTAVVHTNVPETYAKLCKMYLRWDRSYIKEEIRFAGILWKRPLPSRLISLIDATITNLRYPVGYLVLVLLTVMMLSHPATFLRLFFAIGLMSVLNVLYYLRSERSWDFIYGVLYSYFSFFALFWVFPFAVFTVRSRSWMTR
jgi:hyaluronan synthase